MNIVAWIGPLTVSLLRGRIERRVRSLECSRKTYARETAEGRLFLKSLTGCQTANTEVRHVQRNLLAFQPPHKDVGRFQIAVDQRRVETVGLSHSRSQTMHNPGSKLRG